MDEKQKEDNTMGGFVLIILVNVGFINTSLMSIYSHSQKDNEDERLQCNNLKKIFFRCKYNFTLPKTEKLIIQESKKMEKSLE